MSIVTRIRDKFILYSTKRMTNHDIYLDHVNNRHKKCSYININNESVICKATGDFDKYVENIKNNYDKIADLYLTINTETKLARSRYCVSVLFDKYDKICTYMVNLSSLREENEVWDVIIDGLGQYDESIIIDKLIYSLLSKESTDIINEQSPENYIIRIELRTDIKYTMAFYRLQFYCILTALYKFVYTITNNRLTEHIVHVYSKETTYDTIDYYIMIKRC